MIVPRDAATTVDDHASAGWVKGIHRVEHTPEWTAANVPRVSHDLLQPFR